MKIVHIIRFIAIFILTSLVWFASPHASAAQEWTRTGKMDLFIFVQGMAEDQAHETIGPVRVTSEVDDFVAFGVGVGYHFNDYLSINFDAFGASTDLKVTNGSTVIKEDSDVSGMDINIDIYPFKSSFSPFLTAGIGYVSFLEDLDDEDCYCRDADEFSTEFSFNLGAGLRWDFTDYFFIKALYRATWTDLEDPGEAFKFHGVSVFAGYLF